METILLLSKVSNKKPIIQETTGMCPVCDSTVIKAVNSGLCRVVYRRKRLYFVCPYLIFDCVDHIDDVIAGFLKI